MKNPSNMAPIVPNKKIPYGLTQETAQVFLAISQLKCIKGLYLCGGTAQSIQMNHRLSEDLDFELIDTRKDRPELDFTGIIGEVKAVFPDAKTEILGQDYFCIYINENKVKLSFFKPENPVKHIHEGYRFNNIVTPSLQDLLGMKLFTICTRNVTRDYYDIYCLLKQGYNLVEGISYASYLSRHSFKSKHILTKLITSELYPINPDFLKMQPRQNVTAEEIKKEMLLAITKENLLSKVIQPKKTHGSPKF